jgi:hypothetical protein
MLTTLQTFFGVSENLNRRLKSATRQAASNGNKSKIATLNLLLGLAVELVKFQHRRLKSGW